MLYSYNSISDFGCYIYRVDLQFSPIMSKEQLIISSLHLMISRGEQIIRCNCQMLLYWDYFKVLKNNITNDLSKTFCIQLYSFSCPVLHVDYQISWSSHISQNLFMYIREVRLRLLHFALKYIILLTHCTKVYFQTL